MHRISSLFFLLLILTFTSCNHQYQDLTERPKARNIILLIGDGMGLAQVSTAYYYQEGTPNFSRFRHIGLHQTTPIGARITDSAAGATAFATGHKSYNSAIGVDADTVPRKTILEMAAGLGMSTGVIATSSLTHATPACF